MVMTAFCLAAYPSRADNAANLPEDAALADSLRYIEEHPPTAVNQNPPLDFPALMAKLAANRVVFVGEMHDHYGHHLNQLAILQALQQRNPNLAIGVEWFQQPFQSVLNDYLAGKISESELLNRSEYYGRWGYDYRLLRPVMAFAKAKHLPVIALNAPVELTRKVAKGGLEALTPAERAQLPPVIHPAEAAYRARLEKAFAAHPQDNKQFEHFLLVQRIWDETMAGNIAHYLQAHPQQPMVVFAGTGHISHGAGVPQDLARQVPGVTVATVANVEEKDAQPGLADYLLLGKAVELPPTGKLGVMLDEKDNALEIIGVEANSAAGKAGLRKGDKLAKVNEVVIHGIADLKLALAAYKPGDKVKVVAQGRDEATPRAYEITLQ